MNHLPDQPPVSLDQFAMIAGIPADGILARIKENPRSLPAFFQSGAKYWFYSDGVAQFLRKLGTFAPAKIHENSYVSD